MASAFILEWSGESETQYHAVLQALKRNGQLAPGNICHIPRAADAGWRFVDIWESEEAFTTYFADRLGTVLSSAGLPAPKVRPWPSYCPPGCLP